MEEQLYSCARLGFFRQSSEVYSCWAVHPPERKPTDQNWGLGIKLTTVSEGPKTLSLWSPTLFSSWFQTWTPRPENSKAKPLIVSPKTLKPMNPMTPNRRILSTYVVTQWSFILGMALMLCVSIPHTHRHTRKPMNLPERSLQPGPSKPWTLNPTPQAQNTT